MDLAKHNKNGSLDLSNQTLEITPDLQTCKNVLDLKLDSNNLTTIGRLPDQLEHLSVRNNKIAFVGGLECPTLKTLDYTSNRLISLEGIGQCPALTELYLSHNYVGDDQIANLLLCKHLRVLDISHNHLRDNTVLEIIQKLVQLEVLNNTCNEFKICKIVNQMDNLRYLMLDSNKLHTLQFGVELPNLTHISVRDNQLKGLDALGQTPGVQEVYADGNGIKQLVLPSLARLEVLSVAGNDIASAAELDCPLLHDINLSRNKLDSFDFLRACSSLKTLNASRNAITTLCTKLRALTTLNVSWNALTRLDGVHYYTHLKNLHAAFNDLASVNSIVGTLKQLGLLEVIDLKANPCTQMFYPQIEQIPTNQASIEFTMKDYDELCPLQDDDAKDARMKYRGAIISLFSTTLRTLDSLKVSEHELEEVLSLDRRGELENLTEIICHSPLQRNLSCSVGPDSPDPLVSKSIEISAEFDADRRMSFSSTKLKFPPEDPESKAGLNPQYNSIAIYDTPGNSMQNSLFKYSASPEAAPYVHTSNLNSPDRAEEGRQSRGNWQETPQNTHKRSASFPLRCSTTGGRQAAALVEVSSPNLTAITEFTGTFSKLPIDELNLKQVDMDIGLDREAVDIGQDAILCEEQYIAQPDVMEEIRLSPYSRKRVSMDNLMITPDAESNKNSAANSRRVHTAVPSQSQAPQNLDIVKRIEEISYKVDQLSDSIEKPLGGHRQTDSMTQTSFEQRVPYLDTKDLGFNTLTEEFNRMYTDRLSAMKEDLISRYKTYVNLLREQDRQTPSLDESMEGIRELATSMEIDSAIRSAKKRKRDRNMVDSSVQTAAVRVYDAGSQTDPEHEPKPFRETATSPLRAAAPNYMAKPPRPVGYLEEFRIREAADAAAQAVRPRLFEDEQIAPRGTELRPLEELPIPLAPLSSRRDADRSFSTLSYTSLRADLDNRARTFSLSPMSRTGLGTDMNKSTPTSALSGKAHSYHLPDLNDDTADQIVTHASIPPRPVLNEEASVSIITELGASSKEFSLLADFVKRHGHTKPLSVVKTYTYCRNFDFQATVGGEADENLNCTNTSVMTEARSEVVPMFHAAPMATLSAIIEEGFGSVYGSGKQNHVFTRSLDAANRLHGRHGTGAKWRVLLCMVSPGICETINSTVDVFLARGEATLDKYSRHNLDSLYFPMNQAYLLLNPSRVIPTYLIEYEASSKY